MTADQAVLRTTLLPGLVSAVQTGIDVGADARGLFEIARVYLPSGEQLPDERWRLAAIVAGGYAAAKGVLEALYEAVKLELRVERSTHPLLHPGKTAATEAGLLGELHPTLLEGTWGAFELDLDTLFTLVPERTVYDDVITYPAVNQDIAVAVDEDVEVGKLVDTARESGGPLLREARVFDVYRGEQVGEGRKSVAIHLAFQSPERTLTDEEAADLRGRIVEALERSFGAELRA
jgi:phenylalanyl-tRNA synthetase beta chain